LLESLVKKLPGVFDFSLYPPKDDQAISFNRVIHYVSGGLEGREERKVGIKSKGLSLLLAVVKAMSVLIRYGGEWPHFVALNSHDHRNDSAPAYQSDKH